jgi:hypothetical protein
MIWNIIDHRKRPYRWKRINAVIEDVANDNSCNDSDQAKLDEDRRILYADRKGVSLREAVEWAQKIDADVTLYLYDEGEGIE